MPRMSAQETFIDHVLDGLAAMFGGHGLYADDVMVAIIAGDVLQGTSKNAIFTHRRFRIGLTIC